MFSPRHITIKEFHVNSPPGDAKGLLLLAHGAGKGMATPFMETMARGLIDSGLRVVRFHFPYMEKMLRSGTKRAPNGGKVLRRCFSELVSHCIETEKVPAQRIIIGGKSMGGRVATMVADKHRVAGVICLGYPFHPPRKPERLRIEPLQVLQTPALICQGERDSHGRREEVRTLAVSSRIRIHWLKDGDGNFKPGKFSPRSHEQNMQEAITACNNFIEQVIKT